MSGGLSCGPCTLPGRTRDRLPEGWLLLATALLRLTNLRPTMLRPGRLRLPPNLPRPTPLRTLLPAPRRPSLLLPSLPMPPLPRLTLA